MKVLVTGAGGAIGKNLVDYLLANTNYSLVLNYYTEDEILHNIKNYNDRISIVVGDIKDKKILAKMFDGVDIFLHLASNVNPVIYNGSFCEAYKYGAEETLSVLEYIKNIKKPLHIIFPSSGGTVYSEMKSEPHKEIDVAHGVSPYGIQKIMFENYFNLICARNKNITCNVLRISNPYGLNLNPERKQGLIDVSINNILNGKDIEIWSSLKTTRDYIYIDDLCSAFVKAIEYQNGFNVYNIGSGKATTIEDILVSLESVFGKKINYKCVINNFYYPEYSVLDIEKTIKELNWKPEIELQEGIKRILTNINGVVICQ